MEDVPTFLEYMIEAFDDRITELEVGTNFRALEAWDSLASVSTAAMIYAEYDVQVSGDELATCETVQDLIALVDEKMN